MTAPAPIIRTAVVARSVEDAFAIFTDRIGAWWPLPTHSIFQANAGGVHFADGQLVERSTDGQEHLWGEVLEWAPPSRLVMTWHPGAEPEADGSMTAGRVTVTFTPEGAGTRVELQHDGWEAYGEAALVRRRGYAGPSAWGHVLDHFADGAEPQIGGADLTALEAAYDGFFDAAAAGTFGPPSEGEWSAEQVIAHVALNDLGMTAVAQALVHRGQPTFDNERCQNLDALDRVIAGRNLEALIAFGRRCAEQAMAAVARLDTEQLQSAVHCRLTSDGETMLDAPMPWGQIAIDIQASRHLPSHTSQLHSLLPSP